MLEATVATRKQLDELGERSALSERNVSARIERLRGEFKQRVLAVHKELEGVSATLSKVDDSASRLEQICRDQQSALAHQRSDLEEAQTLILRSFRECVGNLDTIRGLMQQLQADGRDASSDKLIREVRKAEYQAVQQVEALLQLRHVLTPPVPSPPLGGWAMDPMAMLCLVNHVLEAKPRLIVECGSGTSTIWLGHAVKKNGVGRIVAIEHNEVFASRTSDAVRRQGLTDVVEVRLAPLEEVAVAGQTRCWYAPSALSELSGIDMLLVDGPPASTGELARYPALPLLADSLSSGCFVVLDDANRAEEKMILKRWKEEFPQFQNGMVLAPRTQGFVWNHAS